MRKRQAVMIGAALLLMAGPAAGEDAWKTYDQPELGFSAAFPVAPTVRHEEQLASLDAPYVVRHTILSGKDGELLYSIDAGDYTAIPAPSGWAGKCAAILGTAGQFGKVLWRTPFPVPGGEGLDSGVMLGDLPIRARYYCADGRVYTLRLASTDHDVGDLRSDAAERFFSAFRRAEPSSPTGQP